MAYVKLPADAHLYNFLFFASARASLAGKEETRSSQLIHQPKLLWYNSLTLMCFFFSLIVMIVMILL